MALCGCGPASGAALLVRGTFINETNKPDFGPPVDIHMTVGNETGTAQNLVPPGGTLEFAVSAVEREIVNFNALQPGTLAILATTNCVVMDTTPGFDARLVTFAGNDPQRVLICWNW